MDVFRRISHWIKAVPAWVWLFLALTQAVNVAASTSRLSDLPNAEQSDDLKGRTPEDQAVVEKMHQKHREFCDRYEQSQWNQLIGALILCPIFLGFGWWRWRSGATQS